MNIIRKSIFPGLRWLFQIPTFPLWFVPLVLFLPGILRGEALFWGTPFLQFMPWRAYGWETLLSGHLPLWNPLVGMGAPLLANYQSAFLYPPNWWLFLLYRLGGISWMAWGQSVLIVAHLIFGGIGMAKLAQRLGVNPLAQMISGLAFSLSGYFVTRSGFLSINAAVAWMPWVVLSVHTSILEQGPGGNGSRIPPRQYGLSLACLTMLLLAGHAQTAWYTLVFASVWLLYGCWRTQGMRAAGIALLRWGAVVVLAGGLAAVQLIPTAEYLNQSQRSTAVEYHFAMNYSFWPWRFISLIAPDFFGNPAQGDYLGDSTYWEDAVYIGLLPFLMAIAVVFQGRLKRPVENQGQEGKPRSLPQIVLFLWVMVFISFLFALGKNTPVYPFLYRYIPTFAMFQAPTRWSLWAVFSLALLAGLGINGWSRPTGRWLYWLRLATMGAFAMMVGAGLTWLLMGNVRPTFIRATTLAGFWGVGAGALNLTAPKKGETAKSWWIWCVVILAALDLLVANWGANPTTTARLYSQPAANLAEVGTQLDQSRLYVSARTQDALKFERFFLFENYQIDEPWQDVRGVYLPDAAMLDHLSTVNNFDPLVPARYKRWMEQLEREDQQTRGNMLAVMGAGVEEKLVNDSPHAVEFQAVNDASRFRLSTCWKGVANESESWKETVDLLRRKNMTFGQNSSIIIEGIMGGNSACGQSQAASGMLVTESPNDLRFSVNADSSGWFFLADVWYPGWTVYVDGVKKEVYRADYLFRAVQVDPGKHVVEWVYRPMSFYAGLVISILCGMGIVIGMVKQTTLKQSTGV